MCPLTHVWNGESKSVVDQLTVPNAPQAIEHVCPLIAVFRSVVVSAVPLLAVPTARLTVFAVAATREAVPLMTANLSEPSGQ
jgi:hypothetical protein